MAELTISPGDIPTAAQWNSYMLHTGSAWNTFTPTITHGVTPTFTNTRATYWRAGRIVGGDVAVTFTSAGSAGSAIQVVLPVPAIAAYVGFIVPIGTGLFYDASATTYYPLLVAIGSTGPFQFLDASATLSNFFGVAGSSFTGATANGDKLSFHYDYEALTG